MRCAISYKQEQRAKGVYHMQVRVLRLGTVCTDKATELEGTLTHWMMDMAAEIDYFFQPRGLDENGQPVNKLFLEEARLDAKASDFETVDVPFEIIGSVVTDKASGFTGMATGFIRHINGCFHVVIQPRGLSPKTKMPIQKRDFDLRGCTGEKIVELTPTALEKSKAERPSPDEDITDCGVPPTDTEVPSRY